MPVGVGLSRARCGDAVDLSRGARTATAGPSCRNESAGGRVLFEPFRFARAEVDITLNEGSVCFGVLEAGAGEPTPLGGNSTDVLVVWVGGRVVARGRSSRVARGGVPAECRPRPGETFTLRLDRAARVFYYIVRGVVSPAQFMDLAAGGPLEFVFFLAGPCTPPSQFTVAGVRVDRASGAAAAAALGATPATRRGDAEVCAAVCGGAAACGVLTS